MKIKGPSELIDLAQFCAECLDISNFDLHIYYADEENEPSGCQVSLDGSYDIVIQKDLDESSKIHHVGHEMVHLRQFKHDELRQINDTQVIWHDKVYTLAEITEEEYFLTPWEMEARALEAWFEFRWDNK